MKSTGLKYALAYTVPFIVIFSLYAESYASYSALVFLFLVVPSVELFTQDGLRRKKKGERYERTLPLHSWNSIYPIGRLLLLELSRHSDHHYRATRKYQTLRHFEESPQMPTGYPGMMLLALVPPLCFLVVHKAIATYKQTQKGASLA